MNLSILTLIALSVAIHSWILFRLTDKPSIDDTIKQNSYTSDLALKTQTKEFETHLFHIVIDAEKLLNP